MSAFEPAFKVLMEHEIRPGHTYSDDPADPGGPTNYGVSLRWLREAGIDVDGDGDVDVDDIKALDLPKSADLYRQRWWDRFHCGLIQNQDVATKVFDMTVNMGPRAVTKKGEIIGAHILVQRALARAGRPVSLDGYLGVSESIPAINEVNPTKLLINIVLEQSERYKAIVKADPTKQRFLAGWMKRAAWPFPEDVAQQLV